MGVIEKPKGYSAEKEVNIKSLVTVLKPALPILAVLVIGTIGFIGWRKQRALKSIG
ncbi:hypothetical protein [Croceitalea rosinachiae]|uniref:Secreted protein with PEP-CTERM sorting signal n=1 Tax=Croceitalea rosinachiae TaxID=3075596 RepID=A0ABU3A6Y8_9FLAO|nr:hypothetical protein [Croceitalea sp. F388]MDT0605948.1 hypothetical protein [Croceitalea sp. F388]